MMADTHRARTQPTSDVLQAPPKPSLDAISLFVDLDGTIAPLELTPQAVGPDRARRRLLDRLWARLDGRLAVVSGRTLADLDRVLEGRIAAVGAVHGLVRRTANGQVLGAETSGRMAEALKALNQIAEADPALLVEDKGVAAALHYRRRPQEEAACRDLAERLGARLGLAVQAGDMVVEVREPGADKGGVVSAFMAEPPFAGHAPVFLGDDLTDEDGFRAARRLGGFGVVVGARRPTEANFALPDVAAARTWLTAALDGLP
jgi:trehalose 6-phosphate phosphatase